VTAYFAVELLAGLAPLKALTASPDHVRAVIVIPAHDEEAVIARTVAELKQEGG
jgi:hypothetical protein